MGAQQRGDRGGGTAVARVATIGSGAGAAVTVMMALLGGCDPGASPRRQFDATVAVDDDDADMPAGSSDDGGSDDGSGGADEPATTPREPLSAEQVQFYLTRIAPTLVGRSLDYDEMQLVAQVGEAALAPIVDGWTAEPGFAEAMRFMVSDMLHTSGERDGVDFDLPGNLAAEIAAENLPYSTLLTADYCVAADGKHIACDTGAPYESGVLATRAYLIANKGRFNLTRAKRMLETFACRIYPMEAQVQVPLAKAQLIPMFQAENPDEQTVDEAKGGFGNGVACYNCHSQFGAHAQFFVRFDDQGLWRADATGKQDPAGELGRALGGLYASHLQAPRAAKSERSQMFGVEAENLRGAMDVLTDSPLFQQCTVKNLLARTFGLAAGVSDDFDAELIAELAQQITADSDDPTLRHYVWSIFTDRRVVDAVVATMEAP